MIDGGDGLNTNRVFQYDLFDEKKLIDEERIRMERSFTWS